MVLYFFCRSFLAQRGKNDLQNDGELLRLHQQHDWQRPE
jgi:hypothetical protein